MNSTIRKVSTATLLLIVLLIAALTKVQFLDSAQLRADPRNFERTQYSEFSRIRGQISANGIVLASSEPTEDRFKFQRVYPTATATMYAPITGFYSLYSAIGIEKSANSILSGADDNFGTQIIDFFTGRTPRGGNVDLTVVPQVQAAAYNGLMQGAGNGAFIGGVAAIRPSTGEILALASSPSYDPNPLASHDTAIVEAASNKLQDGDRSLNRATQEVLPPGSTFKVVSAAAYLQHGVTASTRVSTASSTLLKGTHTRLENYGGSTCGKGKTTTFQMAFRYSCNVPFVELSDRISIDDFRNTAAAFGIGEAYDIGLDNSPSTIGSVADRPALAQSVIGQRDVALTPLQSAIITATVANRGMRMAPYLIKSELSHDLKPLTTHEPREVRQAIPASVAQQLTNLMLDAESSLNGNGNPMRITIASKTGTAEHGESSSTSIPYTWYTAFAPDYDIAVSVMIVSGPGITAGTVGADYAATIGRQVITSAAQAASAAKEGSR